MLLQVQVKHLFDGVNLHPADKGRSICTTNDEREMDQAQFINQTTLKHIIIQRRTPFHHQRFDVIFVVELSEKEGVVNLCLSRDKDMNTLLFEGVHPFFRSVL